MVATIELARDQRQNPELPKLLEKGYFRAFYQLAGIGHSEVVRAEDPESVRVILGVIAISKGLRVHARFLVEFSEDELLEVGPFS